MCASAGDGTCTVPTSVRAEAENQICRSESEANGGAKKGLGIPGRHAASKTATAATTTTMVSNLRIKRNS